MSKKGIREDLAKIDGIRGLIRHTSPTKIWSFMGWEGYYR